MKETVVWEAGLVGLETKVILPALPGTSCETVACDLGIKRETRI